MQTQNEPDPDTLAPTPIQQNRSVKRAIRATNRDEALRLRRQGLSFEAIGTRLGVTKHTAAGWIRDAIRSAPTEDVEEVRALELERLDMLLTRNLGKAISGDVRAGEFVLKIMERRAKYLNLDASTAAGVAAVGSLLDRLIEGESE